MKGGCSEVKAAQNYAGADPGLNDGEGKKREHCQAMPFQLGVNEDGSGNGGNGSDDEIRQKPVGIMD